MDSLRKCVYYLLDGVVDRKCVEQARVFQVAQIDGDRWFLRFVRFGKYKQSTHLIKKIYNIFRKYFKDYNKKNN